MPLVELDPKSIVDIRPRRLDGSLESDSDPTWLTFQLSCNVLIDDDDRKIVAEAHLEARGAEEKDAEDAELIYKGLVAVQVVLTDEAPITQDAQYALAILKASWPHMRAILADHGRRVGAPQTTLPMDFESINFSASGD